MTTEELTIPQKLAAPFPVEDLKFFPVSLTKDKAKGKVGTYIDARDVQQRLDDVMGPGGWQSAYRCIDPEAKAVECTLSLLIDGQWISRADVGYPNEAKDADNAGKEPWKAAYSDATKRAAVQWGIARYIYDLELAQDWLPVDEWGKFTEKPRLKGDRSPRTVSAGATNSGSAPQEAAERAETPKPVPIGTLRLGEWRKPDHTPDFVKFHSHLNDNGWKAPEITLVVKPEGDKLKPSDYLAWLHANPQKSLMDLSKEIAEAVKKRESVPA